jgi:D-glycero-D-manno-heptose 1,7-bisphosphate phosphatase
MVEAEAVSLRANCRKAVFLDRDGVLNVRAPEHDYVRRVSDFRIVPGVADAVARLTAAGLLVMVVTNQRGIARKLVEIAEVERMHQKLQETVEQAKGKIERFYICPHDHGDGCDCRKPSPGMLLRAQRDYCLDLRNSWMVGDTESDVEAGRRAGCRTILISPTSGENVLGVQPDYRAASLSDAVDHILIASNEISQTRGA